MSLQNALQLIRNLADAPEHEQTPSFVNGQARRALSELQDEGVIPFQEIGGTYLFVSHEDLHVLITLQGNDQYANNHYAIVSVDPLDDQPVKTNCFTGTEPEAAAIIAREYSGWTIGRLSIRGVPIENGCVAGLLSLGGDH